MIDIDPNAPSTFPGAQLLNTYLVRPISAGFEKTQHWIGFNAKPQDTEQEALFQGFQSGYDTMATDTEAETSSPDMYSQSGFFMSNALRAQRIQRVRDNIMLRVIIGCIVASAIFLILAVIVDKTGRHKQYVTVDIGVIFGVVASLTFAVSGMAITGSRKHARRSVKGVFFFLLSLICVGNGALLALVISGG
jgi:hypothetical protein